MLQEILPLTLAPPTQVSYEQQEMREEAEAVFGNEQELQELLEFTDGQALAPTEDGGRKEKYDEEEDEDEVHSMRRTQPQP